MGSAPFATVAVAGHVPQSGVYCKGTPPYCGHSVDYEIMYQDEGDDLFYHYDSLAGASRSFVSATLIISIALMIWTRPRA
jgi:hypothetical protein